MSAQLTSQRRDWTPHDDHLLKNLLEEDQTHAFIGQRLGRTRRAIDQRIQKLGLSNKRPNRKFTPEEIEQIKLLRRNKTNIQQIANALSRSYQSTASKIHAMGL